MPEAHSSKPSLNDALDAEMRGLIPIGPNELAEHLRSVITDWIGPETAGLQQACEALARWDRQQFWREPPPWLLKR